MLISEKEKIKSSNPEIKPKTIFHLSAYGAYAHQRQKINQIIHTDATVNLVNECKNLNLKFSSIQVQILNTVLEKKMNEKDLVRPNSNYAILKQQLRYSVNRIIINNLPIVTVRPFHVYGPYEEPTRLIPTLIRNLLKNKNSLSSHLLLLEI